MKDYLIIINWHMPYPKELQLRKSASNFHTAVARGIKEWRLTIPKKQVKELTIKIIKL